MAQKLKKIGDKLRGKMRMLSVLYMTTMLCLQPALATNGAFKMKNIKGVIILLVMVPIFWWILKMLMISRIDKMKFLMFYIA